MTSQETAAFVQQVSDAQAFTYVTIASITVFTYDILLTLSREVEHIWKPRPFFRLGTILYQATRYPLLLFIIMNFYMDSAEFTSATTCTSLVRFINVLEFLPLIGVNGLLIARSYAISSQNILSLVLLLPLAFVSIGFKVLTTVLQTCLLTLDTQERIILGNTIQTAITVAFDTIVFLITLRFMLSTVRKQSSLPDPFAKNSILFLFVYQGAMRYGFVLTVTVTDAAIFKTLRVGLQGILGPVQNVLSVLIICRFQLDLRERYAKRDDCTLNERTLGTFKAAIGRVHEAVITEFGDTEFIDSMQTR